MKSIFAFLSLMVIVGLTCGYYMPIDLVVYSEPCGCSSDAKLADPNHNDNFHVEEARRSVVKQKFRRDVEHVKESKTKMKLKLYGNDIKPRKFMSFKDSQLKSTSSKSAMVKTFDRDEYRDNFARLHENQTPNSQALTAAPSKFGDNFKMALNGLQKTGSKIIETYNSIKDLAHRKTFEMSQF